MIACGSLLLLPTVEHRTIVLQKMDSMRAKLEGVSGESGKGSKEPGKIARLLWPRFVELWIFAAVVTFFIVRVLGSHTWQNILSRVAHRHLP
jgi:hypothetical protein